MIIFVVICISFCHQTYSDAPDEMHRIVVFQMSFNDVTSMKLYYIYLERKSQSEMFRILQYVCLSIKSRSNSFNSVLWKSEGELSGIKRNEWPEQWQVSTQQTRDMNQMLGQCWTSIVDGGPILTQHWIHVSCLMDRDCEKVHSEKNN